MNLPEEVWCMIHKLRFSKFRKAKLFLKHNLKFLPEEKIHIEGGLVYHYIRRLKKEPTLEIVWYWSETSDFYSEKVFLYSKGTLGAATNGGTFWDNRFFFYR